MIMNNNIIMEHWYQKSETERMLKHKVDIFQQHCWGITTSFGIQVLPLDFYHLPSGNDEQLWRTGKAIHFLRTVNHHFYHLQTDHCP